MESNESAAQEGVEVEAVALESAPEETTEVTEETVQEETVAKENPATQGSEPSKAVRELIEQRKKRQKAEQEAAYWRGQAEARATQPEPTKQPAPVVQGPPQTPKLDDYETFDEYEKAKEEYVIQAAEHRIAQRIQQQQQASRAQTVEQAFEARFAQAAKEDPTILEIRNDNTLPVSKVMGQLIQHSDEGIQVLKWLGKNREEAARISRLDPMRTAIEFGKIEASLSAAPKQEQPKKVSAAPAPISTVKTTTPTAVNEDDLPMEEYYKRRTKAVYGR